MKVICTHCNTEQDVNVRRTPLNMAKCEKCGKVRLRSLQKVRDNYRQGHPWRVKLERV